MGKTGKGEGEEREGRKVMGAEREGDREKQEYEAEGQGR